jgi:hypothetical protein
MTLSAERLSTWELCPRRAQWTSQYHTRVSMMGALYRALAAGLTTDKNPEQSAINELLAIASNPGLDIYGENIYAIATSASWLAGIIAQALRNAFPAPWSLWADSDIENPSGPPVAWRSGLWNAGDGIPRRLVLVDKWSDDRQASERRNWRTLGEAVALGRSIAVTAIEIGVSREKRRVSPWTRCYRHPRNDVFRFRRLNSDEDFSHAWKAVWREDSGITTADWLKQMQKDGVLDAVKTMNVPPPARPADFLARMCEIAEEMERCEGGTPPMRLAGCNDILSGPCPFLSVCHGARVPVPERYGFQRREPPTTLPDTASVSLVSKSLER